MMKEHPQQNKVRCHLIEENSLLNQGGELLLEQGNRIFGIIFPNPEIDFENSHFLVQTQVEEWRTNGVL